MPHRKKTACPVFLRTGSSVADPAGRAAAYWEDNGLPPEREIQKTSSGDRFFQTQPEKLCADAAAPAVREAGAAVIVRFGQLQPLDSIAEQLRCDVSKIGGAR